MLVKRACENKEKNNVEKESKENYEEEDALEERRSKTIPRSFDQDH